MRNARPLLRAAILCISFLPAGFVPSALAQSPSTGGESKPDVEERWLQPGSYDATEQAWRLEEALERYREIERRGGWNKVPTDLVVGPGYSYDCARIAMLERRLIAEGYLRRGSTPPPPPPPPPPVQRRAGPGQKPAVPAAPPRRSDEPMGLGGPCKYGPALAAAVRAFQDDRKILGVGQVGSQTMAQLNRPVREIVEILERDVARWRKVSLDPSGTFVLVNIPFFELGVFERGREVLRMPVIVGLPSWQTPLFNDEIEYIIVNPDWGIPDSIAKQEILPLGRRDPGYFRRQGITVSGEGLRQKPGPRNPLGRIKFAMPNQYDVYLHDTPEKRAFSAAVRALSHGCIRLGKPIDFANYLLRDDPQWSPARLQQAIASGQTQQINLRSHMPVHIIYSTSRVNHEGRVELRPDVYARNRRAVREDDGLRRAGDEILDAGP